MKKNGNATNQYYETLVQNNQKGALYFIKLVNDPVVYRAMPLVHLGFDRGDDQTFFMKVVRPAGHKGVYKVRLKDIEMLDGIHA